MRRLQNYLLILGFGIFTAACSASDASNQGSDLTRVSSSSRPTAIQPMERQNITTPLPESASFAPTSFSANSPAPTSTGNQSNAQESESTESAETDEENSEEALEQEIRSIEAANKMALEKYRIDMEAASKQQLYAYLNGDSNDENFKTMMELASLTMIIGGMQQMIESALQKPDADPCAPSAVGTQAEQTEKILNAIFLNSAMQSALR